ncbi:MAG: hypothetical protein AAF401_11830 [Pseudomonadota bacterium]
MRPTGLIAAMMALLPICALAGTLSFLGEQDALGADFPKRWTLTTEQHEEGLSYFAFADEFNRSHVQVFGMERGLNGIETDGDFKTGFVTRFRTQYVGAQPWKVVKNDRLIVDGAEGRYTVENAWLKVDGRDRFISIAFPEVQPKNYWLGLFIYSTVADQGQKYDLRKIVEALSLPE